MSEYQNGNRIQNSMLRRALRMFATTTPGSKRFLEKAHFAWEILQAIQTRKDLIREAKLPRRRLYLVQ